MSKSLGNYVGITETPREMFGKLMSISDEQMWLYYELSDGILLPRDRGKRLREEVRAHGHAASHGWQRCDSRTSSSRGFMGSAAAKTAEDEFQRVFRDRLAPEEAPRHVLSRSPDPKRLTALLAELNFPPASRSDAERLVKQGGVEIDGVRVSDIKAEVELSQPREFLLRAGKKKFVRLVVE